MGRATMIKLVAQSIPIYPMAAFQLPKRLCEDMDSIVRRFWWNPKKDASNYFSPKTWEVICRPLKEGRLGFRSFYNINAAMLAKLAWWVLSGKEIPCIKVLLAKYKVGKNWLKAPPVKSASWTWRSLERVKHILLNGSCKLVGDGDSILVWDDPWIPDLPSFTPNSRENLGLNQCLVVSQLMNQNRTRWDVSRLKDLMPIQWRQF